MKVVILTQHASPHFAGGTEVAVEAQARALAERGCDVRIVAGTDRPHAGDDGHDVEQHRVGDIPVAILPRHEDEFYDLLLKRERLRGLAGELTAQADLVHVHHWSTLDRELVRTLAVDRPVVVTLHDLFVTCPRFFREPQHGVQACPPPAEFGACVDCVAPDVPTIPRPSIHEGFRQRHDHFRAELAAASAVVAPSRSHLERVAHHVPIDALTRVVAHGLAASPGDVRGCALDWDGQGVLRVGFLGNRARLKGAHDLVAAAASLPAQMRARLRIAFFGAAVEDGLDEALLEAAGDVVLEFHGAYELSCLAQDVARAGGLHLVCQPSRAFESYGLVVDEALALGLSVWVSDRGAPQERVGAAGRVLQAAAPDAWAAALGSVLEDPEALRAERDAVPARVRTADDAAGELLALYHQLLEARR